MIATVEFTVYARRRRDTEALADTLEALLRLHTVGEGDLEYVGVFPAPTPKKRGGRIVLRVDVADTREGVIARLAAVQAELDGNANLIDRINEYRVHAYSDFKIVGFVQGDFRGWLRDEALADLAEARA